MIDNENSEQMHSITSTVKEIGSLVQEYRRWAGFTQQKLEGKSRAYIIGVENGSLNDISLSFVYDLADIFKCDVTDFLPVRRVTVEIPDCRGETIGREVLYALLRTIGDNLPGIQSDEHMRTWGAGFPAAEYKALSPQAAAQKLCADFSLSVPVDMEGVLKRASVLMVSIPLNEDIATVLDTRSSVPVVFLDSTIAAGQSKKRAALAHALGHYIAEYGFKGIYIDKKERLVPSESHLSMQDEISERKARAFATALLLPQDVFREQLSDAAKKSGGNDDKAVARIAAVFGVSVLVVIAALALLHSGDGKK